LSGDDGNNYQSDDFLSKELGPSAFRDEVLQEMNENQEQLPQSGRGECSCSFRRTSNTCVGSIWDVIVRSGVLIPPSQKALDKR
jgi:hypothetical protein